MKKIISIIILLILSSCGTLLDSQYKSWSSGLTGCMPEDVKIEGQKNIAWAGQGINWIAVCKGEKYICSHSGKASCTKAK